MRKLASIQRVWDVQPIENSDNLEVISVEGWKCVANKGQFKKGDLCVYFEIDSFLPIRPEFEFLRSSSYRKTDIMGEGFKLRTMRFRGQLSQGLALPLDTFKDLPGEADVAVGMDVTEWLGVKKWEIEERATTGGTVVGNLPHDVPHTDEVRCFVGTTKITTDKGFVSISDIVNKKIECKALTYNQNTNEFEWNKITNYFKRIAIEPRCKITFPFKYNENRTNSLIGSLNHKVLTQNGWTELRNINVNDTIFIPSKHYHKQVIQFISGMLLGDSSIAYENRVNKNNTKYKKRRILFTQGEKQVDYLREKLRLLSCDKPLRKGKSGYSDNIVYLANLNVDDTIDEWLNEIYKHSKTKTISQEFAKYITPVSLAFWYMDDGTLHKYNDRNWSSQISFSSEGFSKEENEILVSVLNKYNIKANIYNINKNNKIYYNIHLNVEETQKFQALIAEYICPSMRYKLDDKWKNVPYLLKDFSIPKIEELIGVEVLSKEIIEPKQKATNLTLYNIETTPNHNYFANRVLVHNCQSNPDLLQAFSGLEYYISTKMDGSSHSLSFDENGFHVCGHNYEYKDDGSSSFYEFVKANHFQGPMMEHADVYNLDSFTVQGEFCAPGIQKNPLRLIKPEWYVFTIRENGKRVGLERMKEICLKCGFNMVPIEEVGMDLPSKYPTVEALLERADGNYSTGGRKEGIVIRTTEPVYNETIGGPLSIKVVSNKYLLKNE